MATLRRHDFEQIEEFLRGLYKNRRVEPLIWYVLRQLPELVGTNQTSWNIVTPALGQADVMAWPEQADHNKYQSALARHVREHPLIVNFLQTGDPSAVKLSDFLSKTQLHNTALYDELYRGLGYEDQFAMNLQSLGPQWNTIVVARDKPTFTERDRLLLNLLRPHLAAAHRQAKHIGRLARRLDSQRVEPATTRITLDRSGAIVGYPSRAQRWMEWYFDELPRSPRHLPDLALQWLIQVRALQAGAKLHQAAAPLVVRRFGRLLTIHLADDREDRTVLLLEERTDPAAIGRLRELRLTPREVEVLLEVEKGKRNEQIAVALGMRPRTVKKHLERIFDKLNVDNRTAAVARFHQIRDSSKYR